MATTPSPGSDRAQLAAKLREIRALTGRSGNRFAQLVGWPQSKVSKIETGVQFPTDDDVATWLRAADAEHEQEQVTRLLRRARVESVSFRQAFAELGGAGAKQRSIGERERQASRVAAFHPAIIPGLLQTPAYARELIELHSGPADQRQSSPEDREQMVTERIARQTLLHERGKALLFVIGEAALWIHYGSRQTRLGQLDRLQTMIDVRGIDLRILPFTSAMPVAPLHGFTIYDEVVMVETLIDEHLYVDPREIDTYRQTFDLLQAAAVAGADAAVLIQRILRSSAE